MKTTLLGKDFCPCCNSNLDSVTDVKGERLPQPNDLSVCMYCCAILYYTADMSVDEFPKVLFDDLDKTTKNTIMDIQKSLQERLHESPTFLEKRRKNKQTYGYNSQVQ